MTQLRNAALSGIMKQDYPEFTKQDFYDFLQIFCRVIEQEVQKGNEIRLENFGTFYPKYNKPKPNVDLHTRQRVTVPESVTFGFHASEALVKRTRKQADIAAVRPKVKPE